MIEFMVLSAPRSGSTWAANWLTTEETLCLHDPLWECHYSKFDSIPSRRRLGLADTGLAKFPDFLAAHPARKVVLHRYLGDCSASLIEIGFGPLKHWEGVLDRIEGWHVPWTDLFDPDKAKPIYEYLIEKEFDAERHALLCNMHVQPQFANIHATDAMRKNAKRLLQELRG